MHNLTEIKNELLDKSFPELKKRRVRARWADLSEDVNLLHCWLNENVKSFLVEADHSLKNAKQVVLIGALAHELSHASIFLTHNYLWRFCETNIIYELGDYLKKKSLPKPIPQLVEMYQTWDERIADELTIKKGFGPELHAFKKHIDKIMIKENRERYNEKDGLTPKEIKRLLKKAK